MNVRKREETIYYERLEINKRIIREKHGKEKPERESDLDVRTDQNKHNESEVTNDNVASGFFGLE